MVNFGSKNCYGMSSSISYDVPAQIDPCTKNLFHPLHFNLNKENCREREFRDIEVK